MNAAIARNVEQTVFVTPIACGPTPGSERVALAVETGLWAEGSVFMEQLAAVVGVDMKIKIGVPYEAAGGVPGLEREAGAVAEASSNRPAGLLFKSDAAGRRDDLGVDGGTAVGEVACCAAGRGDP